MLKKYKLDHCVNYVGWQDDVSKYLSLAKIFVLTSDNDQLPSSLLEAMAMGLVPVVTKVGNLSDVVDDKNVIDLNDNSRKRFTDKILELITDEALFNKQSKQALKKVKNFSIEANSARWEYVIDNLKEKKNEKSISDQYI